MLKKIRRLTTTIFVKLIITLIILSFAAWGIGDLFRNKLTEHVAKVGKLSISKEYLDYRTNNLLEQYKNTKQQIDQSIIRKATLSNIIKEKIVDYESDSLGYRASNKLAFSLISKESFFLDKDGSFDNNKFKNYLLQRNISEQNLFQNLRQNITSEVFSNALRTNALSFSKLYKLQSDYINEERTVSLITIKTPQHIKNVSTPTESELLDFYGKNKQNYLNPETRNFQIIDFSCNKFLSQIKISDQEIKEEFDSNSNIYQIPQKRKILQLFSKSKDSIDEAYKKLNNGKNFEIIAVELKMKNSDIDLGLQNRRKLYHSFVEPIFSLDKNQYTEPIKGPFGWHIFKVTEIHSGKKVALSQVKNDIAENLKKQKSCKIAISNFNSAEDDIASGMKLVDIAKKYNLDLLKFKNIKVKDSLKIGTLDITNSEPLLRQIFLTSDTNKLYTKLFGDENFVIYSLKQVNSSRYFTLDEIRGVLSEEWRIAKHKEKYNNISNTIYDILNKSPDIRKKLYLLKKQYKFSIANNIYTRDSEKIPLEFLEQIFNLDDNKISKPFYDQKNHQYLLAILNSTKVKKSSPGQQMFLDENLKDNYLGYFNNSVMDSYLNYLMKKHKVEINQKLLDS